MRKKNLLLIAAALMLNVSLFAQNPQTITIGSGTTTSYNTPFSCYYKNSYEQMLYNVNDIGYVGTINGIAWQCATPAQTLVTTMLQIYVGETAMTTHDQTPTNANWIDVANLTLVYSSTGDTIGGVDGWETYMFDTPFTYSGAGNLAVVVAKRCDNYNNQLKYYYTSTANSVLYKQNDSDTTQAYYSTVSSSGSAVGSKSAYLPNVQLLMDVTGTPCFAPTVSVADSLTTMTSAVVNWVAGGNEAAWNLKYGPAGFDVTTEGTAVNGLTATTYTINGLTPATVYDVYVQAACSANETSMWSAKATVITACPPYATVPFTEDFEAYEGTTSTASAAPHSLPACWDYINTGSQYPGSPYIYSSTSASHESAKCVRLHTYKNSTDTYSDQYAILPAVQNVNTLQMTLFARRYSTSTTYYADLVVGTISGTDATTFVPIDTITPAGTTYEFFTVYFDSYVGNNENIALYLPRPTENSRYNSLYVDDITVSEIPSCFAPTAIVASNLTTTSAEIAWTAGGTETAWTLAYGATGTPVGNMTTVAAPTNPFTLTGLTPATTYEVYVKANCSATEESEWSMFSGSFGTKCDPNTVFPWTENFENYTASSSGVALSDPCWVNEHISGSGTYVFQVYNSTSGMSGNTTNMLRLPDMSNGTMTKLVLPGMAIPAGTNYQFVIDVLRNASGTSYTSEGIRVFASTNGEIDSAAVELGYLYRNFTQTDNGVVGAEAASGWYTYEFSIPFQGTCYIILRGESQYGAATYTDNYIIREAPSCLAPTGVTASNITSSSAEITWTENGTATAWTIAYGAAGTDVDSMTMVAATTNPVSLTGLASYTTYNVYVKANCSETDESAWSGACAFTTGAAVPFVETFDGTSIPTGWAMYTGLLDDVMAGTATVTSTTYGWSFGSNNGVFDNHARVNIYGTTCNRWLVSPSIELTGNVQLAFDLALTAYNGTLGAPATSGTDDRFVVLALTQNGLTVLRQWDNADGSAYVYNNIACSATGEYVAIDLSAFAGQTINIVFYGESTATNADNNLHIDNISIDAAPACANPTGVMVNNVTATSAEISWTENGTATEWTIAYGTVETPMDSLTTVVATTNPFTITGLAPETGYYAFVKANCSQTLISDMSNIVGFLTPESCPTPSDLACTGYTATTATLAWTENGTATAWTIAYGPVGTPADSMATVAATTNPYTLTGLTAETPYEAYVKANCSDTDASHWSAVAAFMPSAAISLTLNDSTATNGYVPVYGLYVDELSKSKFIIPASDLQAMTWGSMTKLVFYASQTSIDWGAAQFNVYVGETTNTTFASADPDYSGMALVYAGSLGIADGMMEILFTTPYTYMGGNLVVGVEQTVSGTYHSSYWYGMTTDAATSFGGYNTSISTKNFVPKVTVSYLEGQAPACLPVTGVAASNITTTSAEISWTENGTATAWTLAYGLAGTPVENMTMVAATNPYTLTGLTAGTVYDVYVRANCSETLASDWSYVSTFATGLCAAEDMCTITFNMFDSYGDGWNGGALYVVDTITNMVAGTVSLADSTVGVATVSVCPGRVYNVVWVAGSFAYEASFVLYNHLGIQMYASGSMTTGTNVVYTFVSDCTVPSCMPVADVAVSSITQTSAVVTWTLMDNTQNNFVVAYGTGTDPDLMQTVTAQTTTATLTGLTAATYYNVFVKAVCSATESSDWSLMASFMTLCNAIDITANDSIFETFDNGLGCWTMYSVTDDNDNYFGVFNELGIDDSTSFLFSSYNSSSDYNQYLISPELNSTSDMMIGFYCAIPTSSSNSESFKILYSTTDNQISSFTNVALDTTITTNLTWMPIVAQVPAAAKYIALNYYSSWQYYLAVDYINIKALPVVEYAITVDNAIANGTVVASAASAPAGETVTLTATPDAGYEFVAYNVYKTGDATVTVPVTGNAFVMPAYDVTVSATFQAVEYTITVDAIANGTVVPSATSAIAGETITLTATPDAEYVFVAYNVYKTGDVTVTVPVTNNTFVMPAYNVTVGATFEYDAVGENAAESATIFPNPTNNNVKVIAKGMTHVTVLNTVGQIVSSQDVDADEFEYNFSDNTAGVYMMQITTTTGTATKRVTVVK